MNYNVYRLTENDHGYYFYFLSSFSESNMDCVAESIEHYISNESTPMNQYLNIIDFDAVKIEKVNISPIDVINRNLPQDSKCMNISQDFATLIPPPKEKKKREAKPKPEKEAKQPKQRGAKKSNQVNILTEPTVVQMN